MVVVMKKVDAPWPRIAWETYIDQSRRDGTAGKSNLFHGRSSTVERTTRQRPSGSRYDYAKGHSTSYNYIKMAKMLFSCHNCFNGKVELDWKHDVLESEIRKYLPLHYIYNIHVTIYIYIYIYIYITNYVLFSCECHYSTTIWRSFVWKKLLFLNVSSANFGLHQRIYNNLKKLINLQ